MSNPHLNKQSTHLSAEPWRDPDPVPMQWAPPPKVIGRHNNKLLVFAVLAATSPLWAPATIFMIVFAWSNFMAGFNGR
jgi:hypothetical protein